MGYPWDNQGRIKGKIREIIKRVVNAG